MPLKNFLKRRLETGSKTAPSTKLLDEDKTICNDFLSKWKQLNGEEENILGSNRNEEEYSEFERGIRLIIFRESSGSRRSQDGVTEGGGRRLVFDSKILVPFNSEDGAGQRYRLRSKPANDTKLLGEMIFGTVSIANLVDCVKVHYIRYPPQIVLTRVFSPSALCSSSTISGGEAAINGSNSAFGITRSASSLSLAQRLEESLERVAAAQRQAEATVEAERRPERSDSALSASVQIPVSMRAAPSIPESIPGSVGAGGISLTPGSANQGMFLNSVHMRIVKSQLCAMTSYEEAEEDNSSLLSGRKSSGVPRTRLGVSLVLAPFPEENVGKNEQLKQFVFAHMALLEPLLFALCSEIVNLLTSTPSAEVLGMLMSSLDLLRTRLARLYLAPRLESPVWPLVAGLEAATSNKTQLEECFVRLCLCPAVSRFSGIERKNFTACLLTALLTHHLSWLTSVSPSTTAKTPQMEGYNPSWAQLSDLYGLLGFPKKMARTIVIGQDPALINFFVAFCSYFLRFNDVFLQEGNLPEQNVLSMDIENVQTFVCRQRPVEPVVSNALKGTALHIMVSAPPTPSKKCDMSSSSTTQEVIELPKCELSSSTPESLMRVSLGRSMLSATSASGYAPFLALQGLLINGNTTNEKMRECIVSDLQLSLAADILDERLSEAAVIVANVDTWQVEVLIHSTGSSEPRTVAVKPAAFVSSLLTESASLCNFMMPAPLVLESLEGRLRELHFRSLAMGEHLRERKFRSTGARPEDLAILFGGDVSDTPLLLAAAATHMGKFFPIGIL